MVLVAQLVRAPRCGRGGCRFKSGRAPLRQGVRLRPLGGELGVEPLTRSPQGFVVRASTEVSPKCSAERQTRH